MRENWGSEQATPSANSPSFCGVACYTAGSVNMVGKICVSWSTASVSIHGNAAELNYPSDFISKSTSSWLISWVSEGTEILRGRLLAQCAMDQNGDLELWLLTAKNSQWPKDSITIYHLQFKAAAWKVPNAPRVVSPMQVCAERLSGSKLHLCFVFFLILLWAPLPSMMSVWGFMNPDEPLVDKADQNRTHVVGWGWHIGQFADCGKSCLNE